MQSKQTESNNRVSRSGIRHKTASTAITAVCRLFCIEPLVPIVIRRRSLYSLQHNIVYVFNICHLERESRGLAKRSIKIIEIMKNLKPKTQYFSAKRLAMLSVLAAMALIMFMVESLFPPLFIPGAKMGLSNIFSLLAVFLLGPTDAIILVVVRTTLGSVFTGNVSTLLYSMTAGVVSVLVSSILVEFAYPRVSIVAISVVSAVVHNLTQNVVFCLISNTPQMFAYMPVLALIGVLAGVIVGFGVWFILRSVPVRTFASVLGVSAEDFISAVNSADVSAHGTQDEEKIATSKKQSDATTAEQTVGQTTDEQENCSAKDEQQIKAAPCTENLPQEDDSNS